MGHISDHVTKPKRISLRNVAKRQSVGQQEILDNGAVGNTGNENSLTIQFNVKVQKVDDLAAF
ncbi:MAG: hypothetical protein V3V00_08755 [Saprospiraceae bacterium]